MALQTKKVGNHWPRPIKLAYSHCRLELAYPSFVSSWDYIVPPKSFRLCAMWENLKSYLLLIHYTLSVSYIWDLWFVYELLMRSIYEDPRYSVYEPHRQILPCSSTIVIAILKLSHCCFQITWHPCNRGLVTWTSSACQIWPMPDFWTVIIWCLHSASVTIKKNYFSLILFSF